MLKQDRRFRSVLLAGATAGTLAALWLGVGDEVQAQIRCRTERPIGRPVDPARLPPNVVNFDPCTNRFTKEDNALRATRGPYISRDQAESKLVGSADALKVRAYFTTHAESVRLIGGTNESSFVDSDREVWAVVARLPPGSGPKPSLAAGMPTPDPQAPKYFYALVDATTGEVYTTGSRGTRNRPDWPAGAPPDTPDDLARDAAREAARAARRPTPVGPPPIKSRPDTESRPPVSVPGSAGR